MTQTQNRLYVAQPASAHPELPFHLMKEVIVIRTPKVRDEKGKLIPGKPEVKKEHQFIDSFPTRELAEDRKAQREERGFF